MKTDLNNTEEEPKNPKEEDLVECPYHPGEFYYPWEYCEQCYIETKE